MKRQIDDSPQRNLWPPGAPSGRTSPSGRVVRKPHHSSRTNGRRRPWRLASTLGSWRKSWKPQTAVTPNSRNSKHPNRSPPIRRRCATSSSDNSADCPKRTPLNAQTTGHEQRDGYRIEKVIFESQPKTLRHRDPLPSRRQTSLPWRPSSPAAHSSNGKARDLYQRAPILIAKSGMAALCYDPIDQGERHQLLDADGNPVITSSTMGHKHGRRWRNPLGQKHGHLSNLGRHSRHRLPLQPPRSRRQNASAAPASPAAAP